MLCASIVSRHVGTEDTAAQYVVIKARVQCHVWHYVTFRESIREKLW